MAVRLPRPASNSLGIFFAGHSFQQSPQPVHLSHVDVAGLLADRHLEVADVAVDRLDLAVGVQLDVAGAGRPRPCAASGCTASSRAWGRSRSGRPCGRRSTARVSTRTTSWPASAMSSAAWMPAMPPPITRARLVDRHVDRLERPVVLDLRDRSCGSRSMALAVASARSSWTHEQCSRMLAISHQVGVEARGLGRRLAEGLLVHVRRAGGDDHAGELVLRDGLADQLLAGVGAHVLVVDRRSATPGVRTQRRRRRRSASTVRAMFSPQWQMKTPMRLMRHRPWRRTRRRRCSLRHLQPRGRPLSRRPWRRPLP